MASPSYISNPPPYLGQLDKIPLAAIEPPYCQILDNFVVENQKLSLRHGDTTYGTVSNWNSTLGMGVYTSTPKMFRADTILGANTMLISDVSTGTFSTAYNPAGIKTATFATFAEFRNYLYVWGDGSIGTDGGYYYNGSTWATAAYTLPGSFKPAASVAYKNRHYLLDYGTSKIAYSDVDGVTGNISGNSVDFSSIFSYSGYVVGIKNISISENVQSQNYFCLIHSSGEVVAYQGSYPLSSDWGIVARFKIPAPAIYRAFIDRRGDTLVITQSGLFSLRDLFLKGAQADDTAISAPIANRWKQYFKAYAQGNYSNGKIQGIWDEFRNYIIILFPWYVTRDGIISIGGTGKGGFLIYDVTQQAWFEHFTPNLANGIESAAFYKNSIYYCNQGTGATYKKEGSSTWTDSAGSTEFQIRSAPMQAKKFGVNKATGIETILETDIYSSLTMKLVLDLGRVTTSGQTIPNPGSSVAKPFFNVGGEGTYIQYDISGTMGGAAIGLNLYDTNLWLEQGGSR